MKEKILSLLKPDVDPTLKLSVVSLFIGKMLELFDGRIIALEARQLQKGDKGDTGEQGVKGLDGKNGTDGKDGKNGVDGLNGKDGKAGKNGKDGKDGVSIIDAYVEMDDHLVFQLNNGNIIDAGELPKAKPASSVHVSGNAWQITVSSTAPANPQLNDLWLQI